MKIFTLALVIIFFSIAVFGFLAMNHGQEHGGCIATTAGGAPTCLDALQNFTLAITPINGAFFILVLFLLLIALGLKIGRTVRVLQPQILNIFSLAFFERGRLSQLFQAKKYFWAWLALREKNQLLSAL